MDFAPKLLKSMIDVDGRASRGWPCKPCTATTLFVRVSSATGEIAHRY